MTKKATYAPSDLKTLFEALAIAPSYLSKRFILKHLVGFTDEELKTNITLVDEETQQRKISNGRGTY